MRDDVLLARAPQQPGPSLQRCNGVAELAFALRGAERETRLCHLHQETPCRALFPRAEQGDPLTAVLLTTSGGLTGGDRLRFKISAQAGASAVVTTQAAEKIYRALDSDCRIDVALEVEDGGWLEWLPQETILFEGARLVRRTEVELAPRARLLACEMLIFGRAARGERLTRGRLLDGWRVRRGDRLVWADALRLEGEIRSQLDHAAGFDAAAACATVLYMADEAPRWLEVARAYADGTDCRAGATVVNGILVMRLLGRDPSAIRAGVQRCIAGLRAAISGLPERLPRVWHT